MQLKLPYFIIFMSIMVFPCIASAVSFVYRVDSRPPEVVFREGFSSHGDNLNLQQHIRGDSCAAGSRDSAYIATTSLLDETYKIARQYYSMSSFSGRMYRYRIRADVNYYNLAPSIQFLESVGVRFTHLERAMMNLQHEVVAMLRVEPENIMEAVELNYDRHSSLVTDGNASSNVRYEDIQTEMNAGIIPALPTPPVSFRQRINAFGTILTACFSLKGVDRGEHKKIQPSYSDIQFYDARTILDEIQSQQVFH